MVNVERHASGQHVVYVSPLVATFNRQQLAMGCGGCCADADDVATEPGWYADGLGPFENRTLACEAVGIDPDAEDWEYQE